MTAQGAATVYNPDSLYQYIDGGADLYLLYDFKALLHQNFKSGATELTADIYEMNKPEDAFGIYASERSPTYKYIAIGVEGYRDKGILNFLADRHYVKLSGSGPNVDTLLDQFARLLSRPHRGSANPAAFARQAASRKPRSAFRTVREERSAGARIPRAGLFGDVHTRASANEADGFRCE